MPRTIELALLGNRTLQTLVRGEFCLLPLPRPLSSGQKSRRDLQWRLAVLYFCARLVDQIDRRSILASRGSAVVRSYRTGEFALWPLGVYTGCDTRRDGSRPARRFACDNARGQAPRACTRAAVKHEPAHAGCALSARDGGLARNPARVRIGGSLVWLTRRMSQAARAVSAYMTRLLTSFAISTGLRLPSILR